MKLLIARESESVLMILADTNTVALDADGITINGKHDPTFTENFYELIEDVTAEAFLIDIMLSKYSWFQLGK